MYNFVVCGVFKNESHILSEWIQHYLRRGVDHIYLVNDNSTDNFQPIINAFSGKVTLFHNDIVTKQVGRQIQIYNKYFRPLLNQTRWMAILDLDEFLYSPQGYHISDVLSHQDSSVSQLKVDWLHFGSSEHVYQPISAVSGFTRRANFTTNATYYSYKSIFKADSLISFDVHQNTVRGATLHFQYSDQTSPPLVINHYAIQSFRFFMDVKSTRGDINNWFDHIKLSRNEAYFRSYDTNEVEDLRLFQQNKALLSFEQSIGVSEDVTLVITSCNRPALLDRTLESFVAMNRYPIAETFLIDDSGVIGCNDAVVAKYADKLPIKSIYNQKNIGQIASIDKVYSYVRTKWIFHCEEDWVFLKPRFIEKSMGVFAANPTEKIYTVWLRPHASTSGHPIVKDTLNRGYHEMMRNFSYVDKGIKYTWGGITFNPGLRKTADCLIVHPYSLRIDKSERNGKTYVGEYAINKAYVDRGFYAMILDDPEGHVDHIGWDQHIPRFWD